ncbi:MAG: tRNA (uridine(34)/cytosine(34)/5-carboxymethylaminomethyluridine(34)-2'-O)-methyltransferase TrmL [Proteobacteria bacterium]|nr:tRNA (uridine(34)/cytosine(34)/5-carboxymethylaminomethyluridine(34)-2'-O)-methyltransferase TrmL [Pseudomonadota bacterium]MDE3208511.1 tRNA (uridine(34)/cytosine(34)/5-carboxymethylaminomethyluridine(34)-2'-O)-methyltransferase TrmL [Pseudomonadota bacterium]
MFNVILFEPEIPPNTGNIIRLCANCGANLHLVQPLGFKLDDNKLKRAGLDYHEFTAIHVHQNWETTLAAFQEERLFAFSTRAKLNYTDVLFKPNDTFVFGPESRGLPLSILDSFETGSKLRLPMLPHSRSLNLSNTVAIVLYEAWRQQGFLGGA